MKLNDSIQTITLTVIFEGLVIGEIVIKCGETHPNYYSNHFIYELYQAENVF